MNPWYEIVVSVRKRGSFGAFWPKSEVLQAASPQAAAAIFREKHGADLDIQQIIRCVPCAQGPKQ